MFRPTLSTALPILSLSSRAPKDNPSFEYLIYLRVGGAGGPRSTGSTGSSPPSSSSLSSFLPTALWYLLSVRFAGFVDFFEWFFFWWGVDFWVFILYFFRFRKKIYVFFWLNRSCDLTSIHLFLKTRDPISTSSTIWENPMESIHQVNYKVRVELWFFNSCIEFVKYAVHCYAMIFNKFSSFL